MPLDVSRHASGTVYSGEGDPRIVELQLRRRRFRKVAPLTLDLTILVSLGGLSFSQPLRWPLWLVGAATVIPWLPIFTIDAARIFRLYQWLALFYVLVVTQTGHFLVHVALTGPAFRLQPDRDGPADNCFPLSSAAQYEHQLRLGLPWRC